MSELRSNAELGFYRCGKCKGNIRFVKKDGRPKVCPECGYGHGTTDVNYVPSILKLNLNDL